MATIAPKTRVHRTSQPGAKSIPSSLVTGTRIPRDYFVTGGTGQSDITVHAGSYHLALKAAGIEVCNIMTYSSILPAIAREIKKPRLIHGAVMETIMAVAHGRKGERTTAGLIYGWLYEKATGRRYGGLVCEHNGDYTEAAIRAKLELSIDELYQNGFSDDYRLDDTRCLVRSFVPEKQYGTALVGLCFTSYVHPILNHA